MCFGAENVKNSDEYKMRHDQCPDCGSNDIKMVISSNHVTYTCRDCGKSAQE